MQCEAIGRRGAISGQSLSGLWRILTSHQEDLARLEAPAQMVVSALQQADWQRAEVCLPVEEKTSSLRVRVWNGAASTQLVVTHRQAVPSLSTTSCSISMLRFNQNSRDTLMLLMLTKGF